MFNMYPHYGRAYIQLHNLMGRIVNPRKPDPDAVWAERDKQLDATNAQRLAEWTLKVIDQRWARRSTDVDTD